MHVAFWKQQSNSLDFMPHWNPSLLLQILIHQVAMGEKSSMVIEQMLFLDLYSINDLILHNTVHFLKSIKSSQVPFSFIYIGKLGSNWFE